MTGNLVTRRDNSLAKYGAYHLKKKLELLPGIICIPFCTGGGGQVEIKTNGKYNHRVCVYAELCAWKRLTSYSDIICPNSATVTAK